MQGVFYFNFVFSNKEDKNGDCETKIFGFTFHTITTSPSEEEWFETSLDELSSEYGIHDWSSSPCPDVVGIGFTTYEVDTVKCAKSLVEKWRKTFKKYKMKYVSDKIYEVKTQYSDMDVYDQIREQTT